MMVRPDNPERQGSAGPSRTSSTRTELFARYIINIGPGDKEH